MKRGPKPKPADLAMRDGTDPSRIVHTASPNLDRPKAPEQLDPIAKTEFEKVVDDMATLGTLARQHVHAIALYASHYSRKVRAEEAVREQGEVIEHANGRQALNPYLKLISEADKQMRSLLSELGLTPASMSRVNVRDPGPAQGDWEGLV